MEDFTQHPLLGLTFHTASKFISWIEKYPRKGELSNYQKDSEITKMFNSEHLRIVAVILWIFKNSTTANKITLSDILFDFDDNPKHYSGNFLHQLNESIPANHSLWALVEDLKQMQESKKAENQEFYIANKVLIPFTDDVLKLIMKNIPKSSQKRHLSRYIDTLQYLENQNKNQSPAT